MTGLPAFLFCLKECVGKRNDESDCGKDARNQKRFLIVLADSFENKRADAYQNGHNANDYLTREHTSDSDTQADGRDIKTES